MIRHSHHLLAWSRRAVALCALALSLPLGAAERGTGDLGLIIERAAGSVQIIETTGNTALGRVEGLGDLSHASVVFSRDGRYGFVFGRDGGLSKVDLLQMRLVGRVEQAGNSIGGAISQDGRVVAVANYEPGGVRLFDSATLAPLAEIPATYGADGKRSKVIGLVDAPGQRFVFSLWDAGEIWDPACCTWSTSRAAARSGSRCAIRIRSWSMTPRPSRRSPGSPPTSRAGSS